MYSFDVPAGGALRRFAAITLTLLMAAPLRPALAHSFLDHASPAVGAEVTGSPPALNLTYTEPVEPAFCSVHVTDASGARVDAGKPAASQGGRVLTVTLKPLEPGVYAVEWHVTSVDTHKTQGHFSFTVKR